MIIDLTSSLFETPLETTVVSGNNGNFWTAYGEWVEYRDKHMASNSRVAAIAVVEMALQDTHMRDVLSRAGCYEIRPKIAKIIKGLDVDPEWDTIKVAAKCIVELNQAAADKRKAADEEHEVKE